MMRSKVQQDTMEQVWITNDTLKNGYNSNTKEFNNLKEGFKDLKSSLGDKKIERATLRSQMQTLLVANNNSKDDNKPFNSSGELIEKLTNLIKQETDTRIYLTKNFEERFSKLETKILAEKSIIEKTITNIQHNPEVAVNDINPIESNYHTNVPHSVVNSNQENKPKEESQQLPEITLSDKPQNIKPPVNLQTESDESNTKDKDISTDLK